jgi:DNA invertase Pin-like site-specific DNA recombinase
MMAGKAAKREAGGYLGGTVPYGFRLVEGQVLTDEDEQKVGQLIARRVAAGKSLRNIAAELEQAGYQPRTGDTWHPNTVRRIATAFTVVPAGRPLQS